jgi:hypothetical protein
VSPAVMMLSRGIRRVPLRYEHPKRERFDYRTMQYVESYQPVFERFYVPAVREWLAGWEQWQKGEHPDQQREDPPEYSYEEWEGKGPDPDFYYPGEAWPDDAEMGICMYESITEGTPISGVYPDTAAGRHDMAAELATGDTSITSHFTAQDWLDVINGQIFGTDIPTGEPVYAREFPRNQDDRQENPNG